MAQLTPALERALQAAVKAANSRQAVATTRDLLQALRCQQNSAAWQMLKQAELIQAALPEPKEEEDGGIFSAPLTRAAERGEYLALGSLYFGTHHMLMGLLREQEGVAGHWLRENGFDPPNDEWQNYSDPGKPLSAPASPLGQQIGWSASLGVFFGIGLTMPGWAGDIYSLLAVTYLPTTILSWTVSRGWVRTSEDCSRCGRRCELTAMFHHETGLCRPCERVVANRPGDRYLQILLGLMGFALLSWGLQPWLGMLLGNLAMGLLLIALSMGLHELGHAAMAWLLGDRILSLHLGRGPVRLCRRFGKTWWYLHLPLLGGLASVMPGRLAGYRLRSILFLLAGPAVNVLIACLLWPHLQANAEWSLSQSWISEFDPWLTLFYVNLGMAGANLIPADIKLDTDRVIGNDGKRILQVLRVGKMGSAKMHQQLSLLRSDMYRQYGNPEAQLEALRNAALLTPPERNLQMGEMLLLLRLERTEEALEVAETLSLPQEQASPEERAVEANNLAWCYFMAGDLQKAERLSAQSLELLPNYSNSCGTRGEVLLALGHFEEGRELLWQAVRKTHCGESAAANMAALVRLAALESDQAEFDRLRELALLLDATQVLPKTMAEQVAKAESRGHCLKAL